MKKKIVHPFRRKEVTLPWHYLLLFLLLFAFFSHAQLRRNNQNSPGKPSLVQAGKVNEVPEAASIHAGSQDERSPLEEMRGKPEELSKRDAFAKHFKNADGSYTAVIGSGPIHYKKDGRWEDIDTKVQKDSYGGYGYSNKANLMESYFGATSSKGIMSKTKEGEIREFLNTRMYWEVNGGEVQPVTSADVAARIDGDKVYYDHLFGKISAEFITLIGKRKLNYIIPDRNGLGIIPQNADYLVFSEELVLPKDWSHEISESGIYIKNSTGEKIYLYESPVSTDAEGGISRELNTVFETSLTGAVLAIKTKVKTSWLLDSKRKFPVMVDPTTTVSPKNMTNWSRSVYDDGFSETAGMFGLYYPNFFSYHIKFDTSSITEPDIAVTSVTGYINFTAGVGTNPTTRKWQFANSADPTVISGIALYNSADLGLSNPVQVSGLGWRNSGFYNNSVTNEYVRAGVLSSGKAVNLAVVPYDTYLNNTYFTVANHTVANRPYLIINWTPVSTDRALIVTEAYTGASYANGSHTFSNNTSVTATSGTRPGYIVTGWSGTGSVPATGTGGSVTFTMTQNSSINWNWEQTGTPKSVLFHNYGGSEQLSFNNSRHSSTTPIFRMSHSTYDATDYQLEINTAANFTGTSWSQIFTGAYPVSAQANFTFNNGFSPTNGTTYYIRARVRGAANIWSAWTTETYSFTYDTGTAVPNWFQTTQPQFQTNQLSGTVADANNDVVTGAGGNRIVNGDFTSGNTNGWTVTGANGAGKTVAVYANAHANFPGNWLGIGSGNTLFQSASGTIVVSQQVDLTNVSQISFKGGAYHYVSCCSDPNPNTKLEFKIGGTLTDANGTIAASLAQGNNNRQDKTVDVSSYNGVQVIKFVMTYNSNWNGNGMARFYIDDLVADAPPAGTITSTPVVLSSVKDATNYTKLRWNQTLGAGSISFKIQQTTLGGSTWSDVPGYAAITESTDGVKEFDLSAMTGFDQIRLVGTLNGAGVKLHDWSILFDNPCTTVGWANLHNPQNGNLCLGSPFTAYGQIYIAGVTEAAGAGAGIEAQFGYSTTNSNPSGAGWTWQNASFSSQQGNNDEFKYDFTPSVAGTYYYTFRYRSGPTCPWSYGGFHSGGGGFWDGTVNVSGLLTVDEAAVAGTAASTVTGSICKGNSVTLSLEDYTGNVHWQSSSDGVAFTDVAGAESAGYTTENLLSKTFFRARVKSGACEDQYSNVLSFDIDLPASFANLQWPGSAGSCANMLYTVYGRVFIGGKTDQAAQSSGLSAEFGWSTVNSHPESWVNWQPALYNGKVDAGDGQLHNEEYKFDFMPPSSGTYYYTFRYKNGTCDYVYGGFANDSNVNHGGIWDGILHRSGELIVGQNTVWNGSSWSIVPGSADYLSAEIQGNYSTSGAGLNVCSLWVTNHSVLNIKVGSPVTVQDQINVDPGSDIVVESDANLIQINDHPNPENSGSITVKRNINVSSERKQYNFLISPVVGANLKTGIYRDGSGNPVSSPSVQYYIEGTNYFGESSGAYIAGRGLAVKEPQTGSGPFYAVFAGAPANGLITISASNSAPAVTTPGIGMRGHNLIGNPYPSNLDLLTFYNANGGDAGNLSSTFRFWDNYKNTTYGQMGSNYNGNSYASYNVKSATGTAATSDAGASGASKKIPGRYVSVGQGFFARIVGVPSTTLKFNNNSRTKDFEDDPFFGKGGAAMDRYWLKMVTPDQLAVQMAVVYFGGGSNGFGSDDSFSAGGSDELYSMTDGLKIGINGRSPFVVSDKVPLGSRHYVAGSYTIAIDQAEGVFANGQNIYLKDNQTGAVANLSEGGYTFSAAAGETTGRFEIIYEPQIVLATDGQVKESLMVYRDGTDFVVRAPDKKITMVEVFDSAGRLILNLRPNSAKAVIDGNRLTNGMYLLKIHQDAQVTTRKILK
ncbi:T9SS type A sorting domain-containing protein [Chryseobacterium koreense]